MARFLCRNGTKIDDDALRGTPLTHAITRGNLEVVKFLVSQGADVNHVTSSHFTPLFYTINWNSDPDIVKFLIDNGADVNAAHNNGKITPLHASTNHFYYNRMCESVRILFENGANPKLRNIDGLTPFHSALKGNYLHQFIKMALEFYPNLIAELNTNRNFPIQYALEQNNQSAFKMILTHCHK